MFFICDNVVYMIEFNKINVIIWDWNGTLLDDADYCVTCMNKVLSKRKMAQINLRQYRNKFTFPVKDYYHAIGFNFKKEAFKIPAMEFINEYYSHLNKAKLHSCSIDVLNFFKDSGFRQFVLSAMEHNELIASLTDKKIINYFEEVAGIGNHYAHSKLEMGKALLSNQKIDPKKALIIGDTIHDLEVANELDTNCVLISNGHQSAQRLLTATSKVIPELLDITQYFLPHSVF